jgi:signal transduction histidine kinase
MTALRLHKIGISAMAGTLYFLTSQVSQTYMVEPYGVAAFCWPAAGVSTGFLIALGPGARWPVLSGVIFANVLDNVLWHHVVVGQQLAYVAGNVAEPLIIAGLIDRALGRNFSTRRVNHILGMLAAMVAGVSVVSTFWTVIFKADLSLSAPAFALWENWFASDLIGNVAMAPLVIGIIDAIRKPPPQKELFEAIAAIAVTAAMTGVIIALPQPLWDTVMPGALLFPALLWLSCRCRPVFAAMGAGVIILGIGWMTAFGLGHLGDTNLPIDVRIKQAQAIMLFVAVGAAILAALFAELRQGAAKLGQSNAMLERELDNKLINIQAATASIAHEVRQPLAAIVTSAETGLRFLNIESPDIERTRVILKRIQEDSQRANEVFKSIRSVFSNLDQSRHPIDVNGIILEALSSLRDVLQVHRVAVHTDLAPDLPSVEGHKGQMQEVVLNLVHNAIEAIGTMGSQNGRVQIKTQIHSRDEIVVSVADTGPGIALERMTSIFEAFVTTKSQGMGLGLAICRLIVERHGGQLVATSDGKTGALFQFFLPVPPKN